jgi:uncharacterized protein YggT (Ycf19 family)
MGLIDVILNLAGLLLWINWRSAGFHERWLKPGVSLLSTLKKAEPRRPHRWYSLAGLAALLMLRAVFYWQIGPAVDWTPDLHLAAIALPFRSDYPGRMLVYSVLSFGLVLGMFYFSLFLLSVANHQLPDTDPLQRWVRLQLGWFERWPLGLRVLLPLLLGTLCWCGPSLGLARMQIIPAPQSIGHLLQQAVVIGACSYLTWRYVIVAFLALHVVNTYVYLGNDPFWTFVNATARNLLRPLAWLPLRVGQLDLSPVLAIGLVWLAADYGGQGLTQLYLQLPLRV